MPTAVSLSQMVDLSLGTPEIGSVNFNVMHSLLHAIIRKLNIADVKADIDEHDRDFLSTSKIRARSTLSDADSGRGEESEDGLSEKSAPPFRPSPYHRMEIKVEKLAQQLEQLNQLPSNSDLFERTTKSRESERPVADMWQYMQLKKRVDANEEGVGKLFSLIEDMMKEMKELKDANKELQDKIKGIDLDDLNKRLNDLEKITTELNDKFSGLPTPEEIAQFVTWPDLEAALKGLRGELEPKERVVIEMSSQTEAPSRPSSSRPMSRVSSGSVGPSEQLLDILERLGRLDDDHNTLKGRVDVIEEELKNKLDKSALEGLELIEQIRKLKEELDALASKPSQGGTLSFLASVIALLSKIRKSASTGTDTDTTIESSSEELLSAYQASQGSFEAYDELAKRIALLEERFKTIQEVLVDDSAYSSDVGDLTSWLAQMENKIASHVPDQPTEEVEIESEKVESIKPEEKKEQPVAKKVEVKEKEVVEERLDEEQELKAEIEEILRDVSDVDSQMLLSAPELQATNDRLKKLAHTLNEQLHHLRDKVFLLDHELKRMSKGVEFALLRAKLAGANDMDSEALSRAQRAISQLQAEVEKLDQTTSNIIDENNRRTKEIQELLAYCDKLQEQKADKDYVQMEVDVKADKRALENKVNHKLFDQTTNEINKLIKEILDKLAGHEEEWKTAYGKLTEDIDGKLDRLELDPLKEWLENRLKALNEKLKKYQTQMDWSEDDAAGIRKQLIQRFHCISCDRPVDMLPTGPVPSLPAQGGLPPTRSPRPYTTFELEQIRQHAKSCLSGKNAMNYERALAMKQLASLKKSDLRAYLVHFKQDLAALSQYKGNFASPETTDYYATPRPCGGSHTLTYPHKRNTKLTHLSHLFREEEVVIPVNKEEVDVQGVDGHIYKGRSDMVRPQKLEARLPTTLGTNNNNLAMNQTALSPQPPQTTARSPKTPVPGKGPLITQQRVRPTSARTPPSPRPSSAGPGQTQGSRPQSARLVHETSQLTPGEPDPEQVPREAFNDQDPDYMDDGQDLLQAQMIQMPSAGETGQ